MRHAPTTLPLSLSVCLSLVLKRTRTAGRRHRRRRLGEKAKRSTEEKRIFLGDGTGQPITHGIHAAEADWRGELRGTWARPAPAPLPDDRPAFCNPPMKSF